MRVFLRPPRARLRGLAGLAGLLCGLTGCPGPNATPGPDAAPQGDALPNPPSPDAAPPDALAVPPADAAPDAPESEPDTPRGDILTTFVTFDLSQHTAVAELTLLAPANGVVVLETTDLTGLTLEDFDGRPVDALVGRDRLTIAAEPFALLSWRARYGFTAHPGFQGLRSDERSTLTWPTACGALFPCHASPADGVLLGAEVVGLPAGTVAVATPRLSTPAPAYMLAFAVGDYTETPLGRSAGGVRLVAHLHPDEADVAPALSELPAVFSFYETHLGPYPFGDVAGPVSVDWGISAVGGMEHHPYWHVSGAQRNLLVNAHEAAHGWFGDGVRLRCWEDEVVSEGVADYLSIVAVTQLTGREGLFDDARAALEAALPRTAERRGRPPGCNEIDPGGDWFRRQIPYKKGALFLQALARRTSEADVLAALGAFAREKVGHAAGVDDLLAALHASTGYDPTACAAAWLFSEDTPADTPCP